MRVEEKKLNEVNITMRTPYTGAIVISISRGEKLLRSEDCYAENGNVNVVCPPFRKDEYTCTIHFDGQEEEHELCVVSKSELQEEKKQEDFWENNKERVKEAAKEVVPDLEPKFEELQNLIDEKTSPLGELADMVSKVPELIDEKTDVMYENIAEIVNDTAETLNTRIEESTNKHSEAMKEVASRNDLTMVDGKIRFLGEGVTDLQGRWERMDNRLRSAFESIKDVSVSTTKQIEKLKKEMSQGKNIQPFFSTIAASGQESITPQGPFDTLTFAGSGITLDPVTRTVTVTRGDVYKVGTPVNGQLAIRSGDGTVYGDPEVTVAPQQLILGSPGDVHIIQGPHADTTGTGGGFRIYSGNGGSTSGAGGLVRLKGGDSTGSSGNGGAAAILGGSSVNGNGGSTSMTSGTSTNANGGSLSLSAGTGNLSTGTGGSITMTAGNGLTKGTFSLRQRNGLYMFASDGTSTSTKQATLDFSAITTSAKTFSFQNITGTVDLVRTGYTVATLPAGVVGNRAYVTDALAPVFLTAVVGGGAVTCPVFYDGAARVAF